MGEQSVCFMLWLSLLVPMSYEDMLDLLGSMSQAIPYAALVEIDRSRRKVGELQGLYLSLLSKSGSINVKHETCALRII